VAATIALVAKCWKDQGQKCVWHIAQVLETLPFNKSKCLSTVRVCYCSFHVFQLNTRIKYKMTHPWSLRIQPVCVGWSNIQFVEIRTCQHQVFFPRRPDHTKSENKKNMFSCEFSMYLCWNRVFGTKKQTYIQILFVFPENWDAMNLYKPLSMCMCARTQKARNWFTNLSKLNASMLGRKCKYRLKSTEQHVMTPLTCKSGILWTMNFLPCDPVPNSSESRFWWGRLW
jgi:hypothetical protein